ncbi:ImmA/IrrE family metallo-endopeptidase [Ureibacillus thermosphaericus]|uniref:ImmA/IrrE family metallo-endopeptidase n=1 Tax=Ureibacillus thermosphaericus TaxID=51173 RepID=UPI0030CA056B
MIIKDNLEMILEHNKTHLPKIKKAMDRIYSLGDPLAHVKPLDFIKTYLYEHANVLQFPIQNADYGGLVYYYNGDYYVHINTAQPRIYENFMWAHEFYHFFFDRDKIKNPDQNFIMIDHIYDEKERLPNLFASEFLINDFVLERSFQFLETAHTKQSLPEKMMRLISIFQIPYKALVVKLAQNELITINEAKNALDYDYRNRIPHDIDKSFFEPSYTINISGFDELYEKAKGLMYEEDLQSIKKSYDKLYEQVLASVHDQRGTKG